MIDDDHHDGDAGDPPIPATELESETETELPGQPLLDPDEDLYAHLPSDGEPGPSEPPDPIIPPEAMSDLADLKKLEIECFASGEIFVTSHWLVKIADGRPVRLTRSRTTEHRDPGQALAVIARALTGPAQLKLVVDNDPEVDQPDPADAQDELSNDGLPFHCAVDTDAPYLGRDLDGTEDTAPPSISDPLFVLTDIWQTMANDPDEFTSEELQTIFAEHGYAEARPATAADVAESPWPLQVWEEIFALTAAGENTLYPSPTRNVLHDVNAALESIDVFDLTDVPTSDDDSNDTGPAAD